MSKWKTITIAAVAALAGAAAPSILTVAGWASFYGFKVLPPNIRLDVWHAAPPDGGTPGVESLWEARWLRTEGDLLSVPVALEGSDSTTFTIRVALIDSLGRQGSFSMWGLFTVTDGEVIRVLDFQR